MTQFFCKYARMECTSRYEGNRAFFTFTTC